MANPRPVDPSRFGLLLSGWFSVDVKVLGVIAILAAVFLVAGALGVLTIP